ncbi:chymotrypsin-2-like [Leptopilina heterotoma]|uniref:chymotrypsin-2-like n=1 Tax=Leptopilina heterotoma TaxID=63436 RepID=UPI001CA7F088|nr:chymotrypsin-2-like [Leptopilina heterotoma]
MIIFSVFLSIFLISFCNAGTLRSNYLDPKIINGEDVKPGEIPYQVSLQKIAKNFHFCGGSILNEAFVITAAHCVVSKNASDIQVIAGTLKLSEPKSVHYVSQIIVHKFYNRTDSWRNDIALLRVKNRFILCNTIQKIPLPYYNMVIDAYEYAVVSGWGRLQYKGPRPDHMQRAQIRIADQNYCRAVYEDHGHFIYPTHICAYDPDIRKGSCKGDSGGPLTVKGFLVGLVSWSNGCAKTDYPTVYTRVPEYLDWIRIHSS